MIDTPVLLIIFRRPDLTERVLHAIAAARPRRLFVAADGPRPGRPEDEEACAATRAVIDRVDWDCEVVKNYAGANRGCGRGPAAAVSWVFEHAEEAIILEDDCLPDPSFFPFAEQLLAHYRHDQRVMHIAGSIYRSEPVPTPYSYVFSQFNSAWGWATWRRAWNYFDASVQLWAELQQTTWLKDLVGDPRAEHYWRSVFDTAYERQGDVSYWDHQWTFACWANSGLSIAPQVNLVSNLGCGPNATHTLRTDDPIGNIPTRTMTFPLRHPSSVLQARDWDREFLQQVVLPRLSEPSPSALRRVASRLTPEFVKRRVRPQTSTVPSAVPQQ